MHPPASPESSISASISTIHVVKERVTGILHWADKVTLLHAVVMLEYFLYIAKCCFCKIKIYFLAVISHKESFQMINSKQTWALALFFQIRSPLILIPWIAIALSLILQIAHRSIAFKKTSGLLLLKSAKKLNHSQKTWFALVHRHLLCSLGWYS